MKFQITQNSFSYLREGDSVSEKKLKTEGFCLNGGKSKLEQINYESLYIQVFTATKIKV